MWRRDWELAFSYFNSYDLLHDLFPYLFSFYAFSFVSFYLPACLYAAGVVIREAWDNQVRWLRLEVQLL